MKKTKLTKLFISVVTGVTMFAAFLSAQDARGTIYIGTYDVQAVFKQHPAQKELAKTSQAAQKQMQSAQQKGEGQQKQQQIQQQYQQNRGKIIKKFHQDVKKKMPVASKAAGVKVVVSDVYYKAGDVKTKDVTPMLVAAFDGSQQNASAEVSEKSRKPLTVGTYDVQAIFKQHPARKELAKALQTARKQMQSAQQKGEGQQKKKQIQQQYQQDRGKIIKKFHQDVKKMMPAAAKAAGVKVVAFEVSYKAGDVKEKDITSKLVEKSKKKQDG